jgi:glycosyltransferase involved in cell wall biosynthesis
LLGESSALNNREGIRIRWATWWPVPYWVERYNALSDQEGVHLEVVFLSNESKFLPIISEKKDWKFTYQIIRKEKAISGYAKVNRRFPMPWTLVGGSFDLLIMPYGDPDFVSAAFLCALLKKKVCVFSPNHQYEERSFSLFREKLKRLVYGSAIGVLTTGIGQKEYVCRYFKNQENIHIVGNPAPRLSRLESLQLTQGRESIRDELGWRNEFVLLYVGRFSREKGLYTLLDSLEKLSARNIQARAVFVGMGPCENDLRDEVESRNLNVEFTGFLEGPALTKRYIAADVFVLPSLSEAWGLVVNEAMEAGLPVVVSDRVGAHQTLVYHGENGFVFQAGNSKSLTAGLVNLYENPKIRGDMSGVSLDIIQKHTIPEWVENVTNAIHKVTAVSRMI